MKPACRATALATLEISKKGSLPALCEEGACLHCVKKGGLPALCEEDCYSSPSITKTCSAVLVNARYALFSDVLCVRPSIPVQAHQNTQSHCDVGTRVGHCA